MKPQPQPDLKGLRRVPLGVLLVAAAILPAVVLAQTTQPAERTASFNFKNAKADVVLAALEQLFDVQFVSEVPLTERLTIASAGKVNAEAMVALIDVALRRQGAAARREGRLIRVVPVSLATARRSSRPATCCARRPPRTSNWSASCWPSWRRKARPCWPDSFG